MPLIASSNATKELNAPSINLDSLVHLKASQNREEVITKLAGMCLEEMEKSRLGWGHFIKKFLATTLTYTSVLALPVAVLAGVIWRYVDSIKNFYMIAGAKDIAYLSSQLGGLWLADYAIGKIFGTRPITIILIAFYDAYRQGAKFLSHQVRDSYTSHEEAMKAILQTNREALKKDLADAYAEIASELVKRAREGKVDTEIKVLKEKLPMINKALETIGLTKADIYKIISPLDDTLRILGRGK